MEARGKYIVPDNHPDNYGETVKFVHLKHPEFRFIVEPQIPFRDTVGNARGVQNLQTALTIVFARRSFTTNSRRVIESVRGNHQIYRGVRSPVWINKVIDDQKVTGCVEVNKVDEAMLQKRAEIERRLRAELAAEMEEAKQPAAVPEAFPEPTPAEPQIVTPSPETGMVCPNCGTMGTGNFCSECGSPFEGSLVEMPGKPKRVWTCKYCGEEFPSGFDLGNHKKTCPYRRQVEVDLPEDQPMIGEAGTGNIGPKNPQSPDMTGLL